MQSGFDRESGNDRSHKKGGATNLLGRLSSKFTFVNSN